MADHKVYNRQDPDFWNPQKRQEEVSDSYLDEQEEDTQEQDFQNFSNDSDSAAYDNEAKYGQDTPGLFSDDQIPEDEEDDLPEPTFTELLHGEPQPVTDNRKEKEQESTPDETDSSANGEARYHNKDVQPFDAAEGQDFYETGTKGRRAADGERNVGQESGSTAPKKQAKPVPASSSASARTTQKPGAPRFTIHRRQVLEGLLLCAAVAALVFLIIYQSRTRTFTSATYRTVNELSSQEDTTYLALGGNILAYSRDGASCLARNGNPIWNVTFEMQQPLVAVSHGVAAIGDYNGSVIYIVNDSQILGSVNTNLPIHGLTVSESGETAAVLSDSDVTWIYLYDDEGAVIAYFKTTMRESGYPLSVAVSPNGRMVAVSHLTMGTNQANTSIAFYNFGPVGQTVTENNVAGYNYEGEIFPFLNYMNNSTLAAVSDKRLVFFTGSADKPTAGTNALFQSQVQSVFANENYIGLIFPDATGQAQYTMQIYNTAGNLESSVSFTMDYTNVQFCADRVVINNDQAMTIYNVDGTLKYEGAFQDVVRAVIPQTSSTSRLSIITRDNTLKEMVLE